MMAAAIIEAIASGWAFCAPLMPSIMISRIEPRTCQYPGLAEALFVQGQFAWELHLRDLCRNAINSLSGY
jgi:hypothetical protein